MATRTNLLPDPGASSASTWGVNWGGGAGTFALGAVSGSPTGNGWIGTFTTAPGSGWNTQTMGVDGTIAGGSTYTGSIYGSHSWSGGQAKVTFEFLAAGGASLGYFSGSAVAIPANSLTRVSAMVVAPSTAVRARIFWDASSTLPGIGSIFKLAAPLIERSSALGSYFDGGTASAAWNGTANASTSTLYIPVLTLTASLDANPSPRVLVVLTDTAPQVQTVNVQRTAEGRTMKVRGGIALFSVGGSSVMDFEAPFGVPAVYQAEQFDVNGLSLGFTDPGSITLAITDTWIHQPLSPTLAIKARIFLDSANDIVRPSPGTVIWTEGATVGRIIGGQRVGLRGTNVRLRMANTADTDRFALMFGSYTSDFPAVLCIRTPPTIRLPRVLFAGCLDPHEISFGNYAMITYQMSIDEVLPPAPGLVIPLLRRKDIDAAFTTRAARAAAYSTRLLRDTDYTRAGLGG
jgi:hypothetical protein